MIVITVKYEGETYVSAPIDDTLTEVVSLLRDGDDKLTFKLQDGKHIVLRSEVIKRAVFLVEKIDQ